MNLGSAGVGAGAAAVDDATDESAKIAAGWQCRMATRPWIHSHLPVGVLQVVPDANGLGLEEAEKQMRAAKTETWMTMVAENDAPRMHATVPSGDALKGSGAVQIEGAAVADGGVAAHVVGAIPIADFAYAAAVAA